MKFAAFITTIFFGFSMVLAEEAEIIMRDGSIFKAEITQYNPQGIMFKEKGRSGLFSKLQKEAVSLPLDDIYMITTKSQGSRVVNKDGKLVNCDVMDDSEAEESIYLVHGGKLMGDIVSIGAEDIVYKYTKSTQKELKKYKKESQKDRSKVDPKKEAAYYYLYANIPISRDEVFMIYHEKTKVSEIITSLADVEEDIPQIVVEEPKEEEAAEPVQELKFHRVTKGQTLSMIASRYGVTPEEIIEWNDLNPKININGYLTPDLQLAIYITVE
ncbi:MAG: LysM peptidoglycan-binding domain-containing protein [Bacteroidales bacterium]|nr:LysM peptidoglycan-binding domain-containing protein [Bacteroidales bacterium]